MIVIPFKTGFIYKTTGMSKLLKSEKFWNLLEIGVVFFSMVSCLEIVAELTKITSCPK